ITQSKSYKIPDFTNTILNRKLNFSKINTNESNKVKRYTESINYYGTRPQVNEVNIINQDEKQDRDNKTDDEQDTNEYNKEYELEQLYRHNDIKDTINYLRNNMRYPCYLPKTKTIYEWLDEIDC